MQMHLEKFRMQMSRQAGASQFTTVLTRPNDILACTHTTDIRYARDVRSHSMVVFSHPRYDIETSYTHCTTKNLSLAWWCIKTVCECAVSCMDTGWQIFFFFFPIVVISVLISCFASLFSFSLFYLLMRFMCVWIFVHRFVCCIPRSYVLVLAYTRPYTV